ncbi:tetratricopeptide repeat protein [Pandoraea fibrosis]|uniref:Tetratricopeptide repeat protein n=1 Tax=Pandoraea fibrosis TaxID=1891094 RepID=A0ABX6HPD8_9BURK|nr:tetratricopeptide repeat protein [Pandoraea fibrosis]QHE94022.1 tetratricopeptide repeat protein [Pandoraea fibrosis]QHF12414.1 tetratricopeptide repeat protein [Pandoraea fibrosis]
MTTPLDARCERARQLSAAGRLDEAIAELRLVLKQSPEFLPALEGLAYVSLRTSAFESAADAFDRVIALVPQPGAQATFDAAMASLQAGRQMRAEALFEATVQQSPDVIGTMHTIGMTWAQAGDSARALVWFERTAAKAPALWQAHFNRGRALGALGRYDEEIDAYRLANAIAPQQPDPLVNLGVALRERHAFTEALQCFREAVKLAPEHAGARTNRAQTNLLMGDFEHGWHDYEWRWQDGGQRRRFSDRLWDGRAPLAGKTVFVYSEQGFGDTLQFVRFVPRLVEMGANVVLSVQAPLVTLLGGFARGVTVLGEHMPVPSFDWQLPLLSLPHLLKAGGNVATHSPYLRASAGREMIWRSMLGAKPEGTLRVGFVWRPRPFPPHRDVALEHWAPVFGTNAQFFSLQVDATDEERAELARYPNVRDIGAKLSDFAETAAVIAQMDLVISADTAVLHVAGALGKPVWGLVNFTPDWRWQLARRDSDWYPSLTLLRQPQRGDWDTVMAQVGADLAAAIRGESTTDAPAPETAQ